MIHKIVPGFPAEPSVATQLAGIVHQLQTQLDRVRESEAILADQVEHLTTELAATRRKLVPSVDVLAAIETRAELHRVSDLARRRWKQLRALRDVIRRALRVLIPGSAAGAILREAELEDEDLTPVPVADAAGETDEGSPT